MSFELFYPLKDSQYNEGILIEEYNEEYAIYLAQKGDDGRVYKRWCKMQIKKDEFTEKALPVKINLGNQNEAIEALKWLLEQLNGDSPF
jgi:hypothetical protein